MNLCVSKSLFACVTTLALSCTVFADSKSELLAQQSKKKQAQSQQAHAKAQETTLLHAQQQQQADEKQAKDSAKKSPLPQGDALKAVSGANLPQR